MTTERREPKLLWRFLENRFTFRGLNSSVGWWVLPVGLCLIWSLVVVVSISPSGRVGSQEVLRADSVLTTMATISAATIVLGLTVVLVGLQLVSRFGSRASRTVTSKPVVGTICSAGLLGVALPLLAALESSMWLRMLALVGFAWAILSLAIAAWLVLIHLNPRWLSVRQLERVVREEKEPERLEGSIREAASVLIEIADGAAEADMDAHVPRRALAFVGLMDLRITGRRDILAELVERISAQARSATHRGHSPLDAARLLAVIGVASQDAEIAAVVLRQISDLVQDALAEQRRTTVRDLLDEAADFATTILVDLLEPADIPWLREQIPGVVDHGLGVDVIDHDDPSAELPAVSSRTWRARQFVVEWALDPGPLTMRDAAPLIELLPTPTSPDPAPTMTEPVPVHAGTKADSGNSGKATTSIRTPHLADCMTDEMIVVAEGDESEAPAEAAERVRRASMMRRERESGAYDVQEMISKELSAVCAAPSPIDEAWPGGWRGRSAFVTDIARLSKSALTLYQSNRFPPSSQVEAAIEQLVDRFLRRDLDQREPEDPLDPLGWRSEEVVLSTQPAFEVTKVLRDLAIEAWRAGYDHRSVTSLRRLIGLFTVTADNDVQRIEQVKENVQIGSLRTTQWGHDTLAAQCRGRQLSLALAPEFAVLGATLFAKDQDNLWRPAFDVVDVVGWAPRGSAVDTAAEAYLWFLAGFDKLAEQFPLGRTWDVVAWDRHPESQRVELPELVRAKFLDELQLWSSMNDPRLAMLTILALWRDAIVSGLADRRDELRKALEEHVIAHGRRDFELEELWSAVESEEELPPQFRERSVHWRVFDIAQAAVQWTDVPPDSNPTVTVELPSVETPDRDLVELIGGRGARRIVSEREYWGVQYQDDAMVFVREADGSRRLLRDCECRARPLIAWGYGGTGPHNLAEILVADALSALAYCPSCAGTIGVAAGTLRCPMCTNGVRKELFDLEVMCNQVTSSLARSAIQTNGKGDAPSGAQWHIRRSELLDELVSSVKSEREVGLQG